MFTRPRWRLAILSLALFGCDKAASRGPVADAAIPDSIVRSDTAGMARARTGVVFDPKSLKVGDKVGELTAAQITTRTAADGTLLGSARFSGEIQLSGTTFRHPDFPDVRSVCFEADSVSAQRMPRWSGDTRRSWFCMENSDEAAVSLALPGDVRPAEIVIGEFVIHRGSSDEVNSAELIRVVQRGAVISSPYPSRSAALISAADAESAAREIVASLRGAGSFGGSLFADTVTLHVSPEGGSGSTRLSREQLRNRSSWTVASIRRHSLVPPASLRDMTTKYGIHFNCREYPLATRSPTLARLPHVGVKLSAVKPASCLQTWNVTMIFSDSTTKPVLVAALYDQWEW